MTAGTWVVERPGAQCMGTRGVLTEDSLSIAAGGRAEWRSADTSKWAGGPVFKHVALSQAAWEAS